MLSCDLMQQADLFLSNEIIKESSLAMKRRKIDVQITGCVRRDDVHYATLLPNPQLAYFEEVTWVELRSDGYSQYGSLWLADEKNPYLILAQPISAGLIQLVEADGKKLLEMQRHALSTLKAKSTAHTKRLMDIITGQNQKKPDCEYCQISFYDSRVAGVHSQALAVNKALKSCGEQGFFLIHGPPGTGKTTVITEIVRHLVSKGEKVLITSHTNVAVDNVLENLFPYFATKMVRFGTKIKVSNSLKALIPKKQDEYTKLESSQIVGATLSKLSIMVLNQKISFDVPYFDTVIIDESSMATMPLALCGVLLAKSFILVGDHKQLPPITKTAMPPRCFSSKNCDKNCESLFKRLIKLYPNSSTMLELQFRSHPAIMGFSSKQFYGDRIQSSKGCQGKKLELSKQIEHEQIKGLINENPVCYVDMNYDDMPYNKPVVDWFPPRDPTGQKNVTPSCFNRYEAAIALKVRHDLIGSGVAAERIWIITPYRLQREIIRKAIRKIYRSLAKDAVFSIYENSTASTVDSIQGKENDVVIYVLTWTPSWGRENRVHAALKDYRRLNVAMTRAKKKLVIVGDICKLSNQYPYSALEKYVRTHGIVVSAPTLRDKDDFLTMVDRCFNEKKKIVDQDLIERAKEAKERLQRELKLQFESREIVIENDRDFESLRNSGEWEDLSISNKCKCYDCNKRSVPFVVKIEFDQKTRTQNISVIPKTKSYGLVNKLHKPGIASWKYETRKPAKLPPLISFQDLKECGLVCGYLREHPNAEDREVAKNVRLLLRRVEHLRPYCNSTVEENDKVSNGFAQDQTDMTKMGENNFRNSKIKHDENQSEDLSALIQCPHCNSKVRRDRLSKHIDRVHRTEDLAKDAETASVSLQQESESPVDDKSELTECCKNCAVKISPKEFDDNDGLCTSCYYHKLHGDIMHNMRRAGLLGKDRNW